jgi:hypothetical protein
MGIPDLPDFACEYCLEARTPRRMVEVHPPGACRVCGGLTEDPWTREGLECLLEQGEILPPLERAAVTVSPDQGRLL